jgi:hypothetical protein
MHRFNEAEGRMFVVDVDIILREINRLVHRDDIKVDALEGLIAPRIWSAARDDLVGLRNYAYLAFAGRWCISGSEVNAVERFSALRIVGGGRADQVVNHSRPTCPRR